MDQLFGKIRILLMNHNIFCSRHPSVERGKFIRDNNCYIIFTIRSKEMVQPQRRTNSITVRGDMGYNDKTFAFLNVFLGFLYFLFVNDFCNHI